MSNEAMRGDLVDLMTPTVALRIGTRVEKINSKHDARAGTVTQSLRPEMWHGQMTHAYMVVWDDCKVPVFVVGNTIRRLANK